MDIFLNNKFLQSIPFAWGVFGGAVRDASSNLNPRDIDVAVDCSRDALDAILKGIPSKKNRFGGHKFTLDSVEYDLWPLAETWQLKRLGVLANFRLLAKTAPFNADCIVYSKLDGLIDYGWYTCKKDGLQVNNALNPHPMFNAMRGVRMCIKYHLWPGTTFTSYINDNLLPKIAVAAIRYKEQYGRNLEQDIEFIYEY